MGIAFLNGNFLPIEQAKISPLDRGFLFGDGIYEVVPSYQGKMVGFKPHMERMKHGLSAIGIPLDWPQQQWSDLCHRLIEENGSGNLGLYLHISRGAYPSRSHRFPREINPTVFAYTFEIGSPPVADKSQVKTYSVSTARDMRWDRRHIKSTALLGNVLHHQQGVEQGNEETLLYNADNELTEASSCNVFVVKNGTLLTPALDHQKLPGVTRYMLLDILRKEGSIPIQERTITMDEVAGADEIWITSSSKEIVPVTEVDGVPVGNGQVGDIWLAAQSLYSANKFNY